jgi:hypothetical protein
MIAVLPPARLAELKRLQRWSLGVGSVCLLACTLGAFFSPTQFFRAYLAAYLFFLSIAHGCFALLMLYYLTGGAWGFLIRRVLEAGMKTLPLLAVLFLPLAFGVRYLYLWARPEIVAATPELLHKHVYLNAPFFWARAALFFLLWLLMVYLLSKWSRQQDKTGDPVLARKLIKLSGPGLVVYGITITFVSVDWLMSLQPAFRSTIFGPLFASGEVLCGLAGALFVLAWLLARPLGNALSLAALNDLGNLLFAFLIIWAYMAFFQFMLIWIANLPYDISWYLARASGGWQTVSWILFLFHFAVPFFLLLLRDIKQNPRSLALIAALLLAMHLLYCYYQVMPAFSETAWTDHWMDLVTPFAVGGLWLAYFLWQLPRLPLLAVHDENQAAAIQLHRVDLDQAAREQEIGHA